ncbi:Retrovirus-related Pol polyprotein from transposon TNT 1-94 [Gossypium australe]|uniref:Retrovirus-related Pol polyprotein from transposon TNT 1-94 n=1 Tax=Gossypium australe TaxID=47621 RepID=A0A5B6VC74_9ROSI|nr:Retrovirus-related Pol polyprotein from transposon TNT 1-94 [Gossypium australe]
MIQLMNSQCEEPIPSLKFVNDLVPVTFEEAAQEAEWRTTLKDEITVIKKNETWELVDRPVRKKVIEVKWVFKTKMNPGGPVNRYKARLVVKGFSQQYGVGFTKTFALVASSSEPVIVFKNQMQEKFEILDLGEMTCFLSQEVNQARDAIFINQKGFTIKILRDMHGEL